MSQKKGGTEIGWVNEIKLMRGSVKDGGHETLFVLCCAVISMSNVCPGKLRLIQSYADATFIITHAALNCLAITAPT